MHAVRSAVRVATQTGSRSQSECLSFKFIAYDGYDIYYDITFVFFSPIEHSTYVTCNIDT